MLIRVSFEVLNTNITLQISNKILFEECFGDAQTSPLDLLEYSITLDLLEHR